MLKKKYAYQWKRKKDKLGEITTKNLLHSTGNSTQNSVTTYGGKNLRKNSEYRYMYNSLFCATKSNTEL